jgi:hypothetical protein
MQIYFSMTSLQNYKFKSREELEIDVRKFVTPAEWKKLSPYDQERMGNQLQIFELQKSLGKNIIVLLFCSAKQGFNHKYTNCAVSCLLFIVA